MLITHNIYRAGLLVLFALIVGSTFTVAQERHSILVGADYTYVKTNILPGCNCVSLNGGGLQLDAGLTSHLAAVADLTIAHRSGITQNNYDLTQTTYTFGARYLPFRPRARWQPFGELLLGGAHTSGSLAPDNTGFGGSNTFALQTGGGVRLPLSSRIVLEPVRVDYLLTKFGNGADDRQNDLRVSVGILFRLKH
ncbi:outer membrane beta-barrel protein [Granulicella sp. S190]|uniref:outer membrane beta-barrel protein n=1 Tax=Granulicella sp. S190 TaxID=1747226 RepID=UPI00131AFC31|nr:outer membrane beta-barrel protein [Granulicella sp. S190]